MRERLHLDLQGVQGLADVHGGRGSERASDCVDDDILGTLLLSSIITSHNDLAMFQK